MKATNKQKGAKVQEQIEVAQQAVNNFNQSGGMDTAKTVSALGAIGLLIGIGQLLASKEVLTWRIVIGRAISSAGLGASSAAVLTWMPDLSLGAQLGIAALIASLGTSGLEKLVQRVIGQPR